MNINKRQADAQARTFLSSVLTNSMFKFHFAIAIWTESHLYIKAKERALFLQTGNITKSEKLKTF